MKKRQQDSVYETESGERTRKLKFICQVLKEKNLDVKTRKVIAKNDSKDKKNRRVPAELTSLEEFLGLVKKV